MLPQLSPAPRDSTSRWLSLIFSASAFADCQLSLPAPSSPASTCCLQLPSLLSRLIWGQRGASTVCPHVPISGVPQVPWCCPWTSPPWWGYPRGTPWVCHTGVIPHPRGAGVPFWWQPWGQQEGEMVTATGQHGSPGGEAERWDGDTRTAPGDSQPRAASPQPCTNRVPLGLALKQLWPQQPWCPSLLPLGCQGLWMGRSQQPGTGWSPHWGQLHPKTALLPSHPLNLPNGSHLYAKSPEKKKSGN